MDNDVITTAILTDANSNADVDSDWDNDLTLDNNDYDNTFTNSNKPNITSNAKSEMIDDNKLLTKLSDYLSLKKSHHNPDLLANVERTKELNEKTDEVMQTLGHKNIDAYLYMLIWFDASECD